MFVARREHNQNEINENEEILDSRLPLNNSFDNLTGNCGILHFVAVCVRRVPRLLPVRTDFVSELEQKLLGKWEAAKDEKKINENEPIVCSTELSSLQLFL